MGLDIFGYSELVVKPIPKEFRARIGHREPIKLKELAQKMSKVPEKDKQMVLSLYLVTRGLEEAYEEALAKDLMEIVRPPSIDVSDESNEWEEREVENGLVYVDWAHHQAYWKSEDTQEAGTGISYSGVGDFRNELNTAIGKSFVIPCDGSADTEKCDQHYQLLKNAWLKWNEKYLDGALPANLDKVMGGEYMAEGGGWEATFFVELSRCYWLGQNGGIVVYC